MLQTNLSTFISELKVTLSLPGNPYDFYDHLLEIGHGNFGSVYSALDKTTNDVVAIKQVSYSGGDTKEKLHEIVRELKIMRSIKHENCVAFKGAFIKDQIFWIVMEYCAGSVYHLMAIIASGFNESQIAYISYYSLKGLAYLHEIGFIHRDVKSANILITEDAVIKLADFGSSSMKVPANSFVGSPYWMAPEVILAMEDGVYDTKSDVWSMGITLYELGERKPPNFHLNTMSAMYHIAQSDPPRLIGDKWSSEFKDVTNSTLKRDPGSRPTVLEILACPFYDRKLDRQEMLKLIVSCSEAAKNIDIDTYRQIKNEIKTCLDAPSSETTSDSNGTDSESQASASASDAALVDDRFGQKLKPNKLFQNVMNVGRYKTATLITAAGINREFRDHQDPGYAHLKNYQNMRKTNNKQLKALELKLQAELQDHKKLYMKNIENYLASHEKLLKALRDKNTLECNKLSKEQSAEEGKLFKKMASAVSSSLDKKERRETGRGDLFDRSKRQKRHKRQKSAATSVEINSEAFEGQDEREEVVLTRSSNTITVCKTAYSTEISSLRTAYFMKLREVQLNHVEAEYRYLIQSREQLGKIEVEEFEKSLKMRVYSLEQIFKMKLQHLEKCHTLENQNQQDYTKKKESDLNRRHLLESRNKPKELKMLETQIKKVYIDSIKTQQQQYKFLLNQSFERYPKSQHVAIKAKLKSEKVQRIMTLQAQMESHLATFLTQQMVEFSEKHERERAELKEQLEHELVSLRNFQASQLDQLRTLRSKELRSLNEKLDLERATLEKKTEQDVTALRSERDSVVDRLRFPSPSLRASSADATTQTTEDTKTGSSSAGTLNIDPGDPSKTIPNDSTDSLPVVRDRKLGKDEKIPA